MIFNTLTLSAIMALHSGQVLYHLTARNRDGTAVRARVNGRVKTWKTRPFDYRVPMKYGIRDCFYLTPANEREWLLSDPTQPTQ